MAGIGRSRERVRRRRERDRAVRRYLADRQAITACETKRDTEIVELRRRISVIEDEAANQIEGLRVDQGFSRMVRALRPPRDRRDGA
ncbi:hypothetical protein [Nocardia bovistercoris]|uniref:Uncharacterized protein n=1 Tax=Nocardia bovistercoris TaxID=2785916 RepID=A0A931IJC8_9NOCA|nr:hypothetical protein [Nocardia bovistercoris]MBH0780663.1 hypothetical protein [Nocardia bovistercoris]